MRLSGGEGRIALQGDTVQVQRLTFQTGRNGTLSATGTVRLTYGPYTLIATEQSIGREDFVEAQRLSALIEKADPKAPALPRLKQTIAGAQQAGLRTAAVLTGVTPAAEFALADPPPDWVLPSIAHLRAVIWPERDAA